MAREAMCKRSAFLVLLRIASFTRTLRLVFAARSPFASEFAAVTDVPLLPENERHRFVRDTGIEPVGVDHFATWVPKLKPTIQ